MKLVHHYPKTIKLAGELSQRIQLTQKRLQAQHPFSVDFAMQDLARTPDSPRRFEEYEGDVSGRILSAWSYSARLLGQMPQKLITIAQRTQQHQNPDGSFGENQLPQGWDYWGRQLWGHGRLLVGLVDYFKLTRGLQFLESAQQLGYYMVNTLPHWQTEQRHDPWFTNYTSLLESLMFLYEISPHTDYLIAAKKIARLIPEYGYVHSHGFLISLVGLAMLYQQSKDDAYLKQLERLCWRNLIRRARQVDGGIVEWFPANSRTEGCSIVDWLRLSLKMWEITKDPVYLDEAELTWLNALNFHQTGNGAFGHADWNSKEYGDEYRESWWCCLMHGLYGHSEIAQLSAVGQQNEIWINFYHSFECQLALPAYELKISVETDYPNDGRIRLEVSPEYQNYFSVHLRVPGWAKSCVAKVNDSPIDAEVRNGYLSISRTWSPDDAIELILPMRLRCEDVRGNPLDVDAPHRPTESDASFFYGPLILGADMRMNSALQEHVYFNPNANYESLRDSDDRIQHPFALPNAHFELHAGRGSNREPILLTPISEQTGYVSWTDDLQNFIPDGEMPIQRTRVRLVHHVIFDVK